MTPIIPKVAAENVHAVQVPFGSILAITGLDLDDEDAHNQLVHNVKTAVEHDRFALVLLDPTKKGAKVRLLGNDEIINALRATMADEVAQDVVDRAVEASLNAVQPVLEQARAAAAQAVDAGAAPFGGEVVDTG